MNSPKVPSKNPLNRRISAYSSKHEDYSYIVPSDNWEAIKALIEQLRLTADSIDKLMPKETERVFTLQNKKPD